MNIQIWKSSYLDTKSRCFHIIHIKNLQIWNVFHHTHPDLEIILFWYQIWMFSHISIYKSPDLECLSSYTSRFGNPPILKPNLDVFTFIHIKISWIGMSFIIHIQIWKSSYFDTKSGCFHIYPYKKSPELECLSSYTSRFGNHPILIPNLDVFTFIHINILLIWNSFHHTHPDLEILLYWYQIWMFSHLSIQKISWFGMPFIIHIQIWKSSYFDTKSGCFHTYPYKKSPDLEYQISYTSRFGNPPILIPNLDVFTFIHIKTSPDLEYQISYTSRFGNPPVLYTKSGCFYCFHIENMIIRNVKNHIHPDLEGFYIH